MKLSKLALSMLLSATASSTTCNAFTINTVRSVTTRKVATKRAFLSTTTTTTTTVSSMNTNTNTNPTLHVPFQQQLHSRQQVVAGLTTTTTTTTTSCTRTSTCLFSTSTTTDNNNNIITKLNDPLLSQKLLNDIDVFIFDCDGVIWKGDSLIDGVSVTLDKLRALGKKLFFVTNNSTKSRIGYKKKFDSLGLSSVQAEEIFSSSFAAAAYLDQINFKSTNQKIYIIGEIGICDELDLLNIPWIGGPNDNNKQPDMSPGGTVTIDTNVGAVIVGFDRYINYYKVQYAQLCINENKSLFIGTNTDAVTHLTDNQEWAGNGSMIGAIKGCTNTEPIIVGKPSSLMIEYIENKYNINNRSRICMVGDRLDTDILFGTNNGLQSVLVLSGVTNEITLLNPSNTIIPNYYANTINDFFVSS